jgi:alpha-2-macroglobulin
MQYKEELVTRAQAGTDAFKIKTALSERKLKAGKPAILKVTVEIKRDASLEHVMIEIPIPGGCSYADKRQSGNVIETHREYFKEKTVVFCENMRAGTYVFQVQLLPRFTGKYHVNPAQISLMYFPVINANTDMVKVGIVE